MNKVCFCCNSELEPAYGDEFDENTPPSEATVWYTLGNYGSTVFDGGEFTGERLEIWICDKCLLDKAQRVLHMKFIKEIKKTEIQHWIDTESCQYHLKKK